MDQTRLRVRSAKARDLARNLAASEGRTMVSVVERALERYALRSTSADKDLAAEADARLQKKAPDRDFNL